MKYEVDFKVGDEVLIKSLNQIGKVLNINYSKKYYKYKLEF